MAPWNAARTKVQLKLTVQRTKMLHDKKDAMVKNARRDIATLVEKGKIETARIKTEGIISEDIHMELLELMELYAETILARFALLDLNSREPDASILPAVASIIHAAPRTELKELQILREMLMSKFGRDFSLDCMENKNDCVPERVMSKLGIYTPDAKLIDMYIYEICKAYEVSFSSEFIPEPKIQEQPNTKTDQDQNDTTDSAITDTKTDSDKIQTNSPPSLSTPASTKKKSGQEELNNLEARFAALKRK